MKEQIGCHDITEAGVTRQSLRKPPVSLQELENSQRSAFLESEKFLILKSELQYLNYFTTIEDSNVGTKAQVVCCSFDKHCKHSIDLCVSKEYILDMMRALVRVNRSKCRSKVVAAALLKYTWPGSEASEYGQKVYGGTTDLWRVLMDEVWQELNATHLNFWQTFDKLNFILSELAINIQHHTEDWDCRNSSFTISYQTCNFSLPYTWVGLLKIYAFAKAKAMMLDKVEQNLQHCEEFCEHLMPDFTTKHEGVILTGTGSLGVCTVVLQKYGKDRLFDLSNWCSWFYLSQWLVDMRAQFATTVMQAKYSPLD